MSGQDDRDRRLVREVFRSTARPPAPDLSSRIRRRFREDRRRRDDSRGLMTTLALAGGLAVVLMGALLFDGGYLLLPGLDGSPAVGPARTLGTADSPGSQQAPTFLLPGGPDAGTLPRFDWSGQRSGSFSLPRAGVVTVLPSGDGSLAALPDGRGGAEVVEPSGRLIARLPSFQAWSSDGAPVACALELESGRPVAVTSDLAVPAAPRRRSVPITAHGAPEGEGGWMLLGCAARADVLVAGSFGQEGSGPYTLAEVDTVRLASGRVISRVPHSGQRLETAPVLSPDGRYLAENDSARRTAEIRDLASGAVVGHLNGLVSAFSGDGRLVLLNSEVGAMPGAQATIMDWRWSRTVWTKAVYAEPLAIRPAASDLVVSLTVPDQRSQRTVVLLLDGRRAVQLEPPPAGGGTLQG